MKRLLKMPAWQAAALAGAVIFAIYAVITLALQGRAHSQALLSNVAGIAAYLFLAIAIALYFNAWRRRPGPAERLVSRYLAESTVVADRMGQPVKVTIAQRIADGKSADAVQTPVTANLEGPLGRGEAHLTLARVSGAWEVLQAELIRDGDVVTLPAGK